MEYKILMVCLGNICRSPMAEGILRKKIHEFNLPVITDSCGTGGWHVGEAPDERMQETGRQNGVPIDDLRARQFTVDDYDTFDFIYVMDTQNYRDVTALARNEADKKKVKLLLDLLHPGLHQSVPDPYYGGQQGFQHVFDLLDEATDIIVKEITRK